MKKFLSIVFSLVLFFSLSIQSIFAQSFKDLKTNHRFYQEINYLVDKNIISGFPDGTFRPNTTVTRAQAAIMIGRALGLDGKQRDTKFEDVKSDLKASGYIDSAVKRGIILGFPDNTFRPDDPVTRGQMAIFLARAFNLKEELNNSFSDVTPNMSSAVYIKRILANGITSGYPDGTFRPNVELTRADFSAFLARALEDKFKVDVPSDKEMKVHFIDVGQGDSSLIVTPSSKVILIDGGKRTAGEKVVSYLKQAGISSIDLLVATHPDADHIGGLLDVLNQIPVKQVLDSGKEHTTQTYIDYLTLINNKNIPFKVAKTGEVIALDPEIKIQVLNSGDNGSTDNNEASVVLKISYNQIDFLFTGDAGFEAEEKMLKKFNVASEILKVSHHGANTGTSLEFVNAVQPEVSVLSYGDNSYGHPTSEVIKRLQAVGSLLYSTMEQGEIVVTTNGVTYNVSSTPWNGIPSTKPNPEKGKIKITNVDLENEVVSIKNEDTKDIKLTGWKLVSVEGNQTFQFPDNYVLKAGATVYVTSGKNAKDQPPIYLKWTNSYIWNNDGDKAELYNSEGEKVSEFN
ncbi:S-layer homology domain-containing protein [Aeribacillus pallidus]|uniref:S-layer homology domain-containing protein n=1 Tax=Aeribacillus pallidus TaxID=33936 RepID=UPI003D236593